MKPDAMKEQKKTDIKRLSWAALSGLLLTCAFPKIGISWFAWFALVPLLVSLRNTSIKKSFFAGMTAGFVHYLTLLYWLVSTMQTYGNIPYYISISILVIFAAYLALYFAIFSACFTWLNLKPAASFFIAPILWVCLEYIRSFMLSGFPWELAGYSQFKWLPIIQVADFTGVYGVSFLIILGNITICFLFLYITKKKLHCFKVTGHILAGACLIFLLLFSSLFLYGKWRINCIDKRISNSPSLKVALVQGNIDQLVKWDREFQESTTRKYIKMSRSDNCRMSTNQKPDLIVWPETAAPFYFLINKRLTQIVENGIRDTGSYFLIGSPSFKLHNKQNEFYNSAYLVNPDGRSVAQYDKTHLVPFGEYIPFSRFFPFLGKIVEGVGDFQSGQKGKTVALGKNRLGVQICYEIIFPGLSRAMVKNNASLLVNITNDAWFGKTSAPYQHFSMAVFRAVENRRSLARSANTGISGFVDPAGRIKGKTDLFTEKVLAQSIPLLNNHSFYTRFGDIFVYICIIALLSVLFIKKLTLNFKGRK